MIIGHLATAVLVKHFSPSEDVVSLVAGSVFPDIGDKGIKYVRRLKAGRSFFHSLLGTAMTLAITALILSGRRYRSFALGYAAHLLADAPQDMPWLYPFRDHQFNFTPYSYGQKVKRTLTHPKYLETVLLFWALLVLSDRLRNKAVAD